jgi:flavin-dependent thymidylate synthase
MSAEDDEQIKPRDDAEPGFPGFPEKLVEDSKRFLEAMAVCPSCGSHAPNLMPATAAEGEVTSICRDPFHRGYTGQRAVVRAADAAQYARPSIPEDQRGQIRVRLLNATPDPLGSVAALCEQYKGNVIRSLSEVTDEQRRACLDDMSKTVLNGPLEAVQFHWQIEGVTRSITHQMVRSRASFFAQESLRFAVPEGDWAEEIPLPPSLAGVVEQRDERQKEIIKSGKIPNDCPQPILALDEWEDAMLNAQNAYERLIELGMPAEEARGVLPHDMPTRIHWVMDLRTLLAEAGKRTCTQSQFPWRLIFAGMASALRQHSNAPHWGARFGDGWQFAAIADRLRPVCFQTGQCGFMAAFDRSCSIRKKVDVFSINRIPPSEWNDRLKHGPMAINNAEWAADAGAARS